MLPSRIGWTMSLAAAALAPVCLAGIVAVNGDTTLEGGWGLFDEACPYAPLEVLISDAELYDFVSTIPSSLGDVELDPAHHLRMIGSGWGTWSHGYTGQVLESAGLPDGTYTMPPGVGAFDAYVEPGPFQWMPFLIVGYASDGTWASIEEDIHGYHGASHFGFYTTDGATLTSVEVHLLAVTHFSIGELRLAPLSCPADVTGDGVVDVLDLLAVLAEWGQHSGPADITGDGLVDTLDLLEILGAWGPCP